MNRVLIVSWPSYVWKTTIVKQLTDKNQNRLVKALTFTTRQPRPWEEHWVDYEFLTIEEFKILERKWLIFQSSVNEKTWDIYGNTNQQLFGHIENWRTPIFILDPNWMSSFRKLLDWKFDVFSIFIMPTSLTDLVNRATMRDWEIDSNKYAQWVAWLDMVRSWKLHYDHWIINWKNIWIAVWELEKIAFRS